jgi:hypothetical protein
VLEDLAERATRVGDDEGHRRHRSAAGDISRAARLRQEQLVAEGPVRFAYGESRADGEAG